MNIRKASLSDLDLIFTMEKRIFHDPWVKTSIRQELNRKNKSLNLIGELVEGEAIGYFFAHLVENEAHILNLALDIPYQNKGCLLYTSPSPRDRG